MPQAVRRAAGERRWQLNLPMALAISALLHLILLLTGALLPERRTLAQAPVEPSVLHFDFADDAEADRDSAPEGQVPFESPQTQPVPLPAPPPQGLPELAAEQRPTAPTELPQPSSPTEADSGGEERREAQALEPPDADERRERQGLTDMPSGGFAAASETAPRRTGDSGELSRRLSEFGRAVDRALSSRSQPQSGAPSNVFAPDLAALPTTGFGVGNMVFESRDYDWSDYYRQIYVQLWRAWHNRLYQTTDEFERWARNSGVYALNDQSQARFIIERGGTVVGIELEGSTGCTPLDASAVDALAEVIFPPLPADFPRDREVVHVRFIAIGNVAEMRPSLRESKARGYF